VAARADAHLEELIENIDIGGPTMIREAARTTRMSPSCLARDYPAIVEEMRPTAAPFRSKPSGA